MDVANLFSSPFPVPCLDLQNMKIDLENCILIFDEAHNLEGATPSGGVID